MILVILILYFLIGIPVTLCKDYDKNSFDSGLFLENVKLKNNHKLVIGNVNINSISKFHIYLFDNLKLIIQGKVDVLVITQTKTDTSFPLNQFEIQGYSKPCRFDRNRNGGDVREDIPSRQSKIDNTPEDIESIFY